MEQKTLLLLEWYWIAPFQTYIISWWSSWMFIKFGFQSSLYPLSLSLSPCVCVCLCEDANSLCYKCSIEIDVVYWKKVGLYTVPLNWLWCMCIITLSCSDCKRLFFFTKYCKRLENYCVVCCLFVLVICKKKFTCCFWNMEEVKLFSALASRTWCICKS
jgi:hypothetical protein